MSTSRSRPVPPRVPFLTPEAAMGSLHQPVLVNEIVAWLTPQEGAGSIIVDGTVGGGGHTVALARRLGAGGRVVGLDRDPAMLDLAEKAVKGAGSPLPVTLVHAAYREMRRVLDELGIDRVQGVLLDLGLSSDQLAWEGRGFSFSTDGPLDMRFDPDEPGPSAADLVNQMREADLAQLFFELGEERFSRRIARRIVEDRKRRPIQTTGELAELVRRSVPAGRGMGRSTRPPGSSRHCGSRSTTSSASSTPRSRRSPTCWRRAAGPRSSASIRWKTAASSGRSRPIPG